MNQYRLLANKTKLVKLLRSKGYHPNVKNARFHKLFRNRTYFLDWWGSDGGYGVQLYVCLGTAYLSVTHDSKDKVIKLTYEELDKFNLREEIKNEA